MINAYKINHIQTAPYSPQSNASERTNQSVLSAIRSYLQNDHRDWDLYLTEIECSLRSSIHAARGVTPFLPYLVMRCIPMAPITNWPVN